jgi:large subunit ribosomal protein L44
MKQILFFRNYSAELYAFSCRLGERFDDSMLRESLTSVSYAEAESSRQRDLGILAKTVFKTNLRLAEKGHKLVTATLLDYVRSAFPYLPEEGVAAFIDFLTSEETMANVSFHMGTKDLILSEVSLCYLPASCCTFIFF